MTEGEILVEWLGEVESEALKEFRLEGHCAHIKNVEFIYQVYNKFPKQTLNGAIPLRYNKACTDIGSMLQEGRTHGLPLQFLIFYRRRKTHIVNYFSRLSGCSLHNGGDHM